MEEDRQEESREHSPPLVLDATAPEFRPCTPLTLRRTESNEELSNLWERLGLNTSPQRLSPSRGWQSINDNSCSSSRRHDYSSCRDSSQCRAHDSLQSLNSAQQQEPRQSSSFSSLSSPQLEEPHNPQLPQPLTLLSSAFDTGSDEEHTPAPSQSALLSSEQHTVFDSAFLGNMSDPNDFTEPPFWLTQFRPRLPGPNVDSPIPHARDRAHARQIQNALTDFHLTITLIDEEAGEDRGKRMELIRAAVVSKMPALQALGVKKHHVVFFYHGREIDWLGNEIWEVITEWEASILEEQTRSRRDRAAEIAWWNSSASRGRQGNDVQW